MKQILPQNSILAWSCWREITNPKRDCIWLVLMKFDSTIEFDCSNDIRSYYWVGLFFYLLLLFLSPSTCYYSFFLFQWYSILQLSLIVPMKFEPDYSQEIRSCWEIEYGEIRGFKYYTKSDIALNSRSCW